MNKEPIYSTRLTHKDQAENITPNHIYLGNLKQIKRGRLVGNVLLDPFLNIPNKFISISGKTNKKVVKIVVDENKEGPDMYGFTHMIRVDEYMLGEEEEISDDIRPERDELRYSKLGISESGIASQDDIDILHTWKTAINKEIGVIASKIDVKIIGKKLDNQTYLKLKVIKRTAGILSQQLQLKLSGLRSERKKEEHKLNEIRFRDVVKEMVSAELFEEIINKLKQEKSKPLKTTPTDDKVEGCVGDCVYPNLGGGNCVNCGQPKIIKAT